jgi:hypothetical protein
MKTKIEIPEKEKKQKTLAIKLTESEYHAIDN